MEDKYEKSEFPPNDIDVESTNALNSGLEVPTEEELRTLVRVADELPYPFFNSVCKPT